jgi:hypothetical protein
MPFNNIKTPIVLLIFNRPDTTEQVFAEIARAKPQKLFVIADGPRPDRPDDVGKCAAARAVIDHVDWECEVLKNYSDVNLGCGYRPATGISWVFEQTEEAIILEDDCVPHPTFFQFCQELLGKYRNNKKVMMISGRNNYATKLSIPYSYYFGRQHSNWGWATWRRAWQLYDIEIKLWPKLRASSWLLDILGNKKAVDYWCHIFDLAYDCIFQVNTWDYQWTFACWAHNGLAIVPHVNLVRNVGFGRNATHTKSANDPRSSVPCAEIFFPLRHPPSVTWDNKTDSIVLKEALKRECPTVYSRLQRKLYARVRHLLRK